MSSKKTFELSEAMAVGWKASWKYFWPYTGIFTTWFMIAACPGLLLWATGMPFSMEGLEVHLLLGAMVWIINDLVASGFILLQLKVLDGEKIYSKDVWSVLPVLLKYMAAGFLFKVICAAGFVLFIVPGIMWQIRFQFYGYFVVDQKMGPIQALKASSRLTQGARMDLFLFGVAQAFFGSIGLFTLGLLAFNVYITNTVACAFVYRQLLPQTPDLPFKPVTAAAATPEPTEARAMHGTWEISAQKPEAVAAPGVEAEAEAAPTSEPVPEPTPVDLPLAADSV